MRLYLSRQRYSTESRLSSYTSTRGCLSGQLLTKLESPLTLADRMQEWFNAREMPHLARGNAVEDVTYTLTNHRSQLAWRSFSSIRTANDLGSLSSRKSFALHIASGKPNLGFFFTGQGAQWHTMGRDLMQCPSFSAELTEAEY